MSPPTPNAIRALAAWAAAFERPGFSMGSWVISEPDENGVTQMPWFRYGPDAEAFQATLGRHGWIEVFAWPAWLETQRGRALAEDRDALATATPEELRKLLTAIVRSDRFTEGSFAGAFESGLLLAIARRAAVLVEES
jgi:hypothetical protein